MSKFPLRAAALFLVFTSLFAQDKSLETIQRSIPRPSGHAIKGPLPRPVLLLQVVARKVVGEQGRLLFFLYDPANPKQGVRKIYEAPKEGHYRFLTPLFGGVGVAIGQELELWKGAKTEMLWLDLLHGKRGPRISTAFGEEWNDGSNYFFLTQDGVHWMDSVQGILTSYAIPLKDANRIGEHSLLGTTTAGGKRRVVKVDIRSGRLKDLGELPEALQIPGNEYDPLSPIGDEAKDGLVYVKESPIKGDSCFDLWFKPDGAPWRRVLQEVRIWKTFGGANARLPFAYLGNQRFAVARTVLDAPRTEFHDHQVPQGSCLTMLVDGMTGRVLEETNPMIYDHNPRLDIPATWWSPEALVAKKESQAVVYAPQNFQWDAKEQVFRLPNGKEIPNSDDASVSGDGRFLVIPSHSGKSDPKGVKLSIRIVDGKTGREKRLMINVKATDASIQTASWQMLCSPSPGPEELRQFQPAPLDPIFDPWR